SGQVAGGRMDQAERGMGLWIIGRKLKRFGARCCRFFGVALAVVCNSEIVPGGGQRRACARSPLEQLKRVIIAIVLEPVDAANDQRFRFGELLAKVVQAANFSQLFLCVLLLAGGTQRDSEVVV